ncbi:alpha/beta hydrolase [Streptomyces sp. NPDC002589]|uniref:alpha/beta fold hydrolase n=1 Tax=Streptomyces sp. NPDC002589 TaxID=3154420 RepID=UPI00332413A9
MNRDIVAVFGAGRAFAPEAARAALARIEGPVLLLAGEVDPGAPLTTMAECAALFPRAPLVVPPGAGHVLWLDDADRFGATTVAFLHGATAHAP